MDNIVINITKVQDNNSHWYWIPNMLLSEFRNDCDELCGREYMDCPDYFDTFESNYGKYSTGGDPDLMPDFFKV